MAFVLEGGREDVHSSRRLPYWREEERDLSLLAGEKKRKAQHKEAYLRYRRRGGTGGGVVEQAVKVDVVHALQ